MLSGYDDIYDQTKVINSYVRICKSACDTFKIQIHCVINIVCFEF